MQPAHTAPFVSSPNKTTKGVDEVAKKAREISVLDVLQKAGGAALLALCTTPALAVDYAVQIGAFKQVPESGYLDAASSYGSLIQTDAGDGVTAYALGPFSSRVDAETSLALVQTHYPDAFIRQVGDSQEVSQPASNRGQSIGQTPAPARVVAGGGDLSSLSAEERGRIVYLDGVLHIKEGDTFTPLSVYQQR